MEKRDHLSSTAARGEGEQEAEDTAWLASSRPAPDHPTVERLAAIVLGAAMLAAVLAPAAMGASAAVVAKTPPLWKNCTAVNKKYPHGIGKAKARDKTSGTPVTTFRRSTKLYSKAMSHNGRLDRDKDGVLCEKA